MFTGRRVKWHASDEPIVKFKIFFDIWWLSLMSQIGHSRAPCYGNLYRKLREPFSVVDPWLILWLTWQKIDILLGEVWKMPLTWLKHCRC